MNLSEVEKRYKDYLKGQEPQTQSKQDKEKVWGQVQDRMHKPLRVSPTWYLAAASVALLLLSSFAFYELNQKESTIAALQAELKQSMNVHVKLEQVNQELTEELIVMKNTPVEKDTVYLTRVIYQEILNDNQRQIVQSLNNQGLPDSSFDNPVSGNLTAGVESLEIEYGETTDDGITPWKFKIRYE
ncbi:MAG: hypothetical protein ACFHWX_09075 [Bacteroidota bacterium]